MTAGTDAATAAYICAHLDDDLEEVAQRPGAPLLRPALAPFLSPGGLLSLGGGPDSARTGTSPPMLATSEVTLLLQVMSIKDASLSREQRSRALAHALGDSLPGDGALTGDADGDGSAAASVADATLQAMEEQQEEQAQQHTPLRPSGGQWRCLRLELSDGFQRLLAVEDASARVRQAYGGVFAKDGISLGSKLRVRIPAGGSATTPACVQHGILRLHPGNTEVLGGRVRALEVFWAAQARQQLAANTGRPSKLQQQQLPPVAAEVPAMGNGLPPSPPAPSPPTGVQPLRCWPAHAARHPPQAPFTTVAFITEVVSDMVINEPPAPGGGGCTYSLLVQLSSPDAVERETQQQQQQSGHTPLAASPDDAAQVCEDDHLTVDLGHAWLLRLVGMPADAFRALSLSTAAADVARLTQTVEAVGQALEQFGKGRFTLARRAGDGIVEVVRAAPEP